MPPQAQRSDCERFLRGSAQISESQTATKSKSMEGKKIYRLKQRTKNISPKIQTVSKLPYRQSIVIFFDSDIIQIKRYFANNKTCFPRSSSTF